MLIYLLGVILSLLGGWYFVFKLLKSYERANYPCYRILFMSFLSWIGFVIAIYNIVKIKGE